jgi:predicted house-cleaning NTP pyrophosphatase (Maf/HAM1 superfamily)
MMRLYLASRSPRRRELLHQIGIDFDTVVFRDGMRADRNRRNPAGRTKTRWSTSSVSPVPRPCMA